MTVDTTPKKILDKLSSGVTVTATDLDVLNEWKTVVDSGTRSIIYDYAQNESKALKTVSAGKTFYLTSVQLWFSNSSGGSAAARVYHGASVNNALAYIRIADGTTDGLVLNFSIPLRFDAGETIYVYGNAATTTATACITGYEI